MNIKQKILLVILCLLSFSVFANNNDPLPSWRDGNVKQSIIQFVESVCDQTSKNYVAPLDRIATIDNDGTLWLEQPIYTQFIFQIDRYMQLAEKNPSLKANPLYKQLATHQFPRLTKNDFVEILRVTSSNFSVDELNVAAKKWLDNAINPKFKHHYTELVYQPMLEVLQYLQANQFTVYIVSGGGQAFIRVFAPSVYHIPTERVIGTTLKTDYVDKNNQPTLMNMPEILFVSDGKGKPAAINLFIGKKPIIAFGNSDGDREMLEWTQSNSYPHLMLLVHHDDAKREYAYDTKSKVGTFSAALMQEAQQAKWQVISMKNDWKVIFPFNKTESNNEKNVARIERSDIRDGK